MPFFNTSSDSLGKDISQSPNSTGGFSKHDLAEKLAQLAAIVEYSEDSILSKDLNGTITSWNPASENLYGYTKDEAIGRSILMIYPPELKEEFKLIIDRVKKG